MKKLIGLLLLLTIFIVGCSSSESDKSANAKSDSSGDSEKQIELSLNTFHPTTDPAVESVFEEWSKLVEEETAGRVTITNYYANQLGAADTGLQDVAGQVYDITLLSPILFNDSELYPFTIAALPYAIPGNEAGFNVLKNFYEKYQKEEKVEYLGAGLADSFVLWSVDQIKTVDDIKGLQVRTASASQVELVKSWGAIPVSIPVADVYESFQKGTLDAAIFSLVGGKDWNYHEVAPYVATMPISTLPFIPVINKEKFASLPEDLQAVFKNNLGPKLGELFAKHYADSTLKVKEEFKGKEIIDLTDEELLTFQKQNKAIWDDWVKNANEKGFDGDAMMKDFQQLITDEGLSLPY